jgi:hypothetical protein
MSSAVEELTHQLMQSVRSLKTRLEQNQIEGLEETLAKVQVAMDAFHRHPGGPDVLIKEIDESEPAKRQEIKTKLQQIKIEHEVCGRLIKLAMQRNAALQAYAAQPDAAATYSPEGGVSMVVGGKLLGRF